jgi:hypothetical protein
MLVDVARIDRIQTDLVARWHAVDPAVEASGDALLDLVMEEHLRNFRLWHLEDVARDRDVTDSEIADVKRAIDAANQQRNDLIERIDARLLEMLAERSLGLDEKAPLNSETPGSIVDRASILALKIFHMSEEAERGDASDEHRSRAASKVEVLREQRADLIGCLEQLLADVVRGDRRFKVYYQMKMYNDPALNPRLYRSAGEKPESRRS